MSEAYVTSLDELSNGRLRLQRLYFAPDSSLSAKLLYIKIVGAPVGGSECSAILPSDQLNAAGLKKAFPFFGVSRKKRDAFDLALAEYLHISVANATSGLLQSQDGDSPCCGYAFTKSGLHKLADGSHVFVLGDQVVGDCNLPCIIRCRENFTANTLPIAEPLPQLFDELCHASPETTLAITFVCTTLLRSWTSADWQAILAIVGKQGLGKTTLARRLTDWIQDADGEPALLFSAGSTVSATRDAMISARDLPMVIDDLCLSASPQLQRKYRDLATQFVREGANAAPIVKKQPDGKPVKLKCAAGVILTAEFALENASDITRCVFIPIDRELKLLPQLSTELVGAACKSFLAWCIAHANQVQKLLRELPQKPHNWIDLPRRTAQNYSALSTVFHLLLCAANAEGTAKSSQKAVAILFRTALNQSLKHQFQLLDKLDRQRKKGNLAALLLAGLEKDAFNLCKKLKKLHNFDGILWKRDLCLRRAALERFIRMQDGYGSYTLSKIVQELKDIGALVIQEEGTAQVHLGKKVPRVYRIRLDVLRDAAQEF